MGSGTLYTGAVNAPEPSTRDRVRAQLQRLDRRGRHHRRCHAHGQPGKYTELAVDQIVDVPGRRLTKRDMTLQTNMAEPTLENLAVAMNAGTVTAGTGVKSLEPAFDTRRRSRTTGRC
ncbi:hypothetical protein HBB16_04465 [Pseudonocardia sp. MCCB 268]|nr:hypothetical protein [Pseudonocardia cytotoxica]